MPDDQLLKMYRWAVSSVHTLMDRAEFLEDLVRERNLDVPQVLDNGYVESTIKP